MLILDFVLKRKQQVKWKRKIRMEYFYSKKDPLELSFNFKNTIQI
ncbi:hypothetical protein Hdeb2414_s0008g00280461 [Helianthus debilis subsp. tardiflorus]